MRRAQQVMAFLMGVALTLYADGAVHGQALRMAAGAIGFAVVAGVALGLSDPPGEAVVTFDDQRIEAVVARVVRRQIRQGSRALVNRRDP